MAARKRTVSRRPRAPGAPRILFPATLRSGATTLALVPSRVLLSFSRPPSKREVSALLDRNALQLEDGTAVGAPQRAVNNTRHQFFAKTRQGTPLDPERLAVLAREAARLRGTVQPVYARSGGRGGLDAMVAALPDGLVLQGLDPRQVEQLAPALDALGLREVPDRSKRLATQRYYAAADHDERAAFRVATRLTDSAVAVGKASVVLELAPLLSPFAIAPVDPTDSLYFGAGTFDVEEPNTQWSMRRIGARFAWGKTLGAATTTIFLFDQGVDLTHTDLSANVSTGTRTQTNPSSGAPIGGFLAGSQHGTVMAGLLCARHNDGGTSMAGLGPQCNFESLAIGGFGITNIAVADAIGYAGSFGGSDVLCLGVEAAFLTDPAIQTAITANPGLLIVVATGNNVGVTDTIDYTSGGGAAFSHLMICGASGQGSGDRNDPWLDYGGSGTTPGSRRGPEISVVAPGEDVVSTQTGGGYQPAGVNRRGTSVATAHVAGLAALIRSNDASLAPAAVRQRIEETAAKSHSERYATNAPGVIWNERMGYGRIDCTAILVTAAPVDAGDLERADAFIRDNPADTGAEPFGGDFWSSGDLALSTSAGAVATGMFNVGGAEDLAFNALQATTPTNVTKTVDNYVFVRVLNLGPAEARGVRVTAVLASCSTGFMYPADWDSPTDPNHVVAEPESPDLSYLYGPMPTGKIFIARLKVPAAADFTAFPYNHACALARVVACNDVTFTRAAPTGGGVQPNRNNVMQRNLNLV